MNDRPTLYILDAYSLIYQVFHAIPLMTGPAGQPTNAVFGIFRDLLNLLKIRKPDYLAAAFDGGGPVFRSEIFADYKGQRKEMPEDLRPQIPVIKRVFEAFRVPVLIEPGFEADDVIATLARRAPSAAWTFIICTSDKDARQLLDDRIRILNFRKNKILDVAGLKADWGITPSQVVDLPRPHRRRRGQRARASPASGSRRPRNCCRSSATWTTSSPTSSKVSGAKRQENLRDHADTARLGRTLVALREDLPIALDWDALRSDGYDAQRPEGPLPRVRLPRLPARDRRGVAAGRGRMGRRLSTVDTPEALATFVAELGRSPEVQRRHRDDLRRPPAGRHRRLFLLVGAGRRLLPARAGARWGAACSTRPRPWSPPAGLDRTRRRRRSARTSSTTCSS